MKWEYWLLKPSALGPTALGPHALLANIPTPLNFQLGNTDTILHSAVQYSTIFLCAESDWDWPGIILQCSEREKATVTMQTRAWLSIDEWPALHCTTLYYTVLHYTALYYTVLHYTALHYTALHCTALHCTALYCTALHCTALQCTMLHCTALHCPVLH